MSLVLLRPSSSLEVVVGLMCLVFGPSWSLEVVVGLVSLVLGPSWSLEVVELVLCLWSFLVLLRPWK
jgi:hypothetical protein